jgi:RNA polymerase sigma-70 factor (ECF subfamily)
MAMLMTEAKLREWMTTLGPRLIALSASICRDRHRAEEIVQEAFVKLWRQPPDGGEPAYPAWMRRVVTNLSINALQRTRRHAELTEFSAAPASRASAGPAEQCEIDDQVDRMRRALDRLDDSKRAILMLRAFEQLSYEEIAATMNVPVGTVMSRLNRARAALIDEMKRDLTADHEAPAVFEFRRYKQA